MVSNYGKGMRRVSYPSGADGGDITWDEADWLADNELVKSSIEKDLGGSEGDINSSGRKVERRRVSSGLIEHSLAHVN